MADLLGFARIVAALGVTLALLLGLVIFGSWLAFAGCAAALDGVVDELAES
jgi:hypothetical protein